MNIENELIDQENGNQLNHMIRKEVDNIVNRLEP